MTMICGVYVYIFFGHCWSSGKSASDRQADSSRTKQDTNGEYELGCVRVLNTVGFYHIKL